MKRIILIGNDKISSMALQVLPNDEEIFCYVDKSTNFKRIVKLLKKRAMPFPLVVKMLLCEVFRPGHKPSSAIPSIKSNVDLARTIKNKCPDEVILFRAGLIINTNVLSLGAKILNIHCARLPDYGGIGTIARALKDNEYDQSATLHVVTKSIDEGEVLKTLPYRLNPSESYCKNEMVAYKAGVQLLKDYLKP